MLTVTRINHVVKTTKGFTVRTPMALGQVWLYRGSRHVVDRVYPKKVRFLCDGGKVLMTCDQAKFVKHSRLKLD
jgi:hypothetical protein